MILSSIVVLAVLSATPSETKLFTSSSAGNNLGSQVSISGTTIAAGAPEDDQNGAYSGSVSVFRDLSLEQTIYGYLPGASDLFGNSVSLDGDTLAVGAPGFDTSGKTDDGMVVVFTRSGTTWSYVASGLVYAPDGVSGDRFGDTVALSGNWLAVGSPGRQTSRGAVYIFQWSGSAWTYVKTFVSPVTSDTNYAEDSMQMAGEWLVVGAEIRNYSFTRDGVAYVYRYNGASWNLDQTLSPSDAGDDLRFGRSVSIDGTTVVVGAPSIGAVAEGAYVFTYNGSDWIEDGKLTPSDGTAGDGFGTSVGVDGSMIAVGSPYDDGTYSNEGSAYVFVDGTQKYKLTTSPDADDNFGMAIAVGGDVVAVGMPNDDTSGTDSGAVCAYEIPAEASSLEFTTHPSSIVLGGTIAPQVTVYDQFGQVFTDTLSVTIAFDTNPTGASLTGTTTVSTSGGVASYSLGVDTIGTGYTLSATSGSLSVISDAFNVTSPADPATKFVILNPIDGTVDAPITVTVQAQNSSNAVVTTYQDDVTLVASGSATGEGLVSIVNGQGILQLSDTVAETVVLTLQDSQSTGLNVSSTQDVVFGVGAATDVQFVVEPIDVQVDAAMQTIIVTVLDQYGNLRSDTGLSVTVALAANPEGAVAYGTTTVTTIDGDATFSDVRVDKAGTFTMVATSGILGSDTSTPFTVTDAPVPPDNGDDDKVCGGGTGTTFLGWLLPLAGLFLTYRRKT